MNAISSPAPNVTSIDTARNARLVARVVSGDAQASRELVELHEGRVLRVCRAVLRDHHDAQDAAQEVWLRVFRNIHRFQGDDLAAWLNTIARNEAYRLATRRGKAPLPVDELPVVPDNDADPLDAAIAADISKAIMGAVNALDDVYREVAIRDLAGQSPAEIAEVLHLSPGASRVRTHRARKRLQQALREEIAA